MEAQEVYHGVGRRKTSVARVWLRPGTGRMVVNDRPLDQYFSRPLWRVLVSQPLKAVGFEGKLDLLANVKGGGLTGQADAIRLGVARALLHADPGLRSILRKGGFLTRDPRAKERKKYGRRGARARFQFSKR